MTEADATKRQQIISTVTDWLRIIMAHDQVTELRALDVQRGRERPHTEAGFFDYEHLAQMAELAVDASAYAKGVYFVMNPLNPDLIARRANRIDYAKEGQQASDKDVIARRWLLVDADPTRDPHISSTKEEKDAALQIILAVKNDLAAQGWPTPILSDSGNGYHLMYRIDLPANDGGIVERILKALAAKYDTSAVHIDQSVFNPARICKMPGTLARKGDSVKSRPHRRARILEIPS
jgi:hypothetical protein